jgi:hypothetical protein
MPLVLDFLARDDEFDDWKESLESPSPEAGPGWSALLEAKLRASASMPPPPPLFIACCFGIVEVLHDNKLLEEIDVNQKNKNGTMALYLASRFGHLQVCLPTHTPCRADFLAWTPSLLHWTLDTEENRGGGIDAVDCS